MSEGSAAKKFILAALGLGGIAAGTRGVIGVVSGLAKHESVLKDAAHVVSAANSMQSDAEHRESLVSSVTSLIDSAKRDLGFGDTKDLVEKKSGIIGYWAWGYDSEVYKIDDWVYIGNRRFNKPRGMNFRLSARDAMGFEVGNFKNDAVKSGGYAGYDSESFLLMLGSISGYELNGWCLVYDELNNVVKMFDYDDNEADGYLKFNDEEVVYVDNEDDSKILAKYNFESGEFEDIEDVGFFGTSHTPDDELKINHDEDDWFFEDEDENTWTYHPYDGTIDFHSENLDFKGNAYKCECTGIYDGDDDWIKYDFETLVGVKITQSDESYGELMVVRPEDKGGSFFENLSGLLADAGKFGANYAVGELISAGVEAVPYLGEIDMLTGGQISGQLSDAAKELLKDSLQSKNPIEEYKDEQEDQSITDKAKDFIDNLFD